jgi:hypothetical protein
LQVENSAKTTYEFGIFKLKNLDLQLKSFAAVFHKGCPEGNSWAALIEPKPIEYY